MTTQHDATRRDLSPLSGRHREPPRSAAQCSALSPVADMRRALCKCATNLKTLRTRARTHTRRRQESAEWVSMQRRLGSAHERSGECSAVQSRESAIGNEQRER